MKISRLEPQQRNPSRVSVHIDGEFRFGLTKSLAIELGPHNIRVLALAPTLISTPGNSPQLPLVINS